MRCAQSILVVITVHFRGSIYGSCVLGLPCRKHSYLLDSDVCTYPAAVITNVPPRFSPYCMDMVAFGFGLKALIFTLL